MDDTFYLFEDRTSKLDLKNHNIRDLLKIKDIIGSNNFILQADNSILVRHYVGFVQINKTKLNIYPKISENNIDEESKELAFKALVNMLKESDYFKSNNIDFSMNLAKVKGDILELFISIFVDEFLKLYRKSIMRDYIQNDEPKIFIKGKIDFSETIKRNILIEKMHWVNYDEFSQNTLINRILKTVILRLLGISKNQNNKKRLKIALNYLKDVDLIGITKDIWNKVVFNRLNKEYETIFNMAKLFFYNYYPKFHTGIENTYSFLIPVNELFEFYLLKQIKKCINDEYNIYYQKPIKYLAKDTKNKNILQMRPDIVVENGDVRVIIDAKYKNPFLNEKENISNSDIYQMISYSIKYNVNDIYLIYPKFINANNNFPIINKYQIDVETKKINIWICQYDLINTVNNKEIFERIIRDICG